MYYNNFIIIVDVEYYHWHNILYDINNMTVDRYKYNYISLFLSMTKLLGCLSSVHVGCIIKNKNTVKYYLTVQLRFFSCKFVFIFSSIHVDKMFYCFKIRTECYSTSHHKIILQYLK
jgi:hypothetical protein